VADTDNPRRKWRRACSLALDKGGVDEHYSRSSSCININQQLAHKHAQCRHHRVLPEVSGLSRLVLPCAVVSPTPALERQVCDALGRCACSAHIEEKHHHSAVELVHEAESWLVGAAHRIPWVKVGSIVPSKL
jgi:hypothetical protein